ncbi:MAG: metal-dependent hydrolase [Acidobacteria bacterium]|nr:metal-dependent hydrolase [Acidobacteriota bacterium]
MNARQVILDTNVSLSRYPFRRLPLDETPKLVAKLKQHKVTRALAGSFDAMLHHDLGAVNERTARECKEYGGGILAPVGCVDPTQPDWREELRRCHEAYRMTAIRLHPNYHGYTLADSAARELFADAARRKLLVQIPLEMEDERTLHPRLKVAPVDWRPCAELAAVGPTLRLQILNCRLFPAIKAKNVWFDFSMTEGVHGIRRLTDSVGTSQVVFGSHAPFYYWESALLKVTESGLDAAALCETNARRMLGELP